MRRIPRILGGLLVFLFWGCGDGGMKPALIDAGAKDASAREATPDSLPSLDVGMVDLPGLKDAVLAVDQAPFPIDSLPKYDLSTTPDLLPPPPDVKPVSDTGTGTQTSDTSPGSTVDTSPLPKDTVIFANADLGSATPQCVAAAPGWRNLLGTFLAEDQKCWADSDCTYVSFTDACGMICPLPMNKQRIGEFSTQVNTYASSNCASCANPTSYPTCPVPRGVYCNSGRCEYR